MLNININVGLPLHDWDIARIIFPLYIYLGKYTNINVEYIYNNNTEL